jgi:hypothetical protein
MAGGAVAAAVTLGWAGPMPSMVDLLATTALIMGGTGHPLADPKGGSYAPSEDPAWVDAYAAAVRNNYLEPTKGDRDDAADDYKLVAVYTPEEFSPVSGTKTFDDSVAEGADNLDGCMTTAGCASHTVLEPTGDSTEYVIVGYSQSSRIASLEKQRLIDEYGDDWSKAPDVSFLLLANPNRPNGGVLMRFHGMSIPFMGITMDGASPTDSCDAQNDCHLPTVDVAQQYDALGGDFPIYPLNPLATANSLAAYALLHGNVPYAGMNGDIVDQGQFGDTHYYLIGSDLLPLLMPLETVGVPRAALLAVDEPLRVLVESAYRRDISPGAPTPAYLIPVINPVSLAVNFVAAVPIGIDDAFEYSGAGRPLGTDAPTHPFGPGGGPAEDGAGLEGLPPGFIPLGAADPTTSTEVQETSAAPQQPLVGDSTKATSRGAGPTTVTPPADRPQLLRNVFRGPIDMDKSNATPSTDSGDRPKGPIRRIIDGLTRPRTDATEPEASTPQSTDGPSTAAAS